MAHGQVHFSREKCAPFSRGGTSAAAVAAAFLLLVGSVMTGLGAWQAALGGYFTTSAVTLSTPTRALVSDEVRVEARRAGDPGPADLGNLARIRVRFESDQPVFVGIAPADRLDQYLESVAYDELRTFRVDPFEVNYQRSHGQSAPEGPTKAKLWVAASANGTLEWNKRAGEWSIIAINRDGSRGVEVTADIGFRFGALLPFGLPLLGAGVLLLALLLVKRPYLATKEVRRRLGR